MFWYGLSLASSHALFITGRDSFLGNDGDDGALLGNSEDSIFGALPEEVEGRSSFGESDIFLPPDEVDGRLRKSGLGRSKKNDLMRFRLFVLLFEEMLSLSSRDRSGEIGISGGGGIDICRSIDI